MLRHALLRTVRFDATHHYGREDWSAARNRAAFGRQLEPHAHHFRVELTVDGPPDPETGFVTDLRGLDAIVEDEILSPLSGGDLNDVIPEVAAGAMQPSTEALAGWIFSRVEPRIEAPARLLRVRVWESDELGGEVCRET